MKSVSFSVCKAILGIILCVLVFLPIGCKSQLGETTAEGHRRHKRALRINNEAMMGDISALGCPVWFLQLIIPITFALMTLRFGFKSFRELSTIFKNS